MLLSWTIHCSMHSSSCVSVSGATWCALLMWGHKQAVRSALGLRQRSEPPSSEPSSSSAEHNSNHSKMQITY